METPLKFPFTSKAWFHVHGYIHKTAKHGSMKITSPSMDNYTPQSRPTQPLTHHQHASHEYVVSPTETHEMRKLLLTSSLAKPRLNAEAILKNWELFICGDIHHNLIL
jgi:hypothetical protein